MKYLSIDEICRAWRINRRTFYRRYRYELPFPRTVKGKRGLYWRASDVRRYVKSLARNKKRKG